MRQSSVVSQQSEKCTEGNGLSPISHFPDCRLPTADCLTRYPLTETRCVVAGREWRIREVKDQDALLRETRTDEDLANFPYGLALWASAVGLGERLASEPGLVRGKRVLEIGAGVGLAGIVARSLGADVTQTDYQEEALALCRHNAEINSVSGVTVRRGDWRDFPADLLGEFDVVFGSDVLYERSLHTALADLLPRLIRRDGFILLADPLRPQAFDFLAARESEGGRVTVEATTTQWEGAPKEIGLFTLGPRHPS